MSRDKKITSQQFEKINWKKSRGEIAADLGVSLTTLARYAEEAGVPHARRGYRASVDWSKVDWTQDTNTIMARTGKSRTWVLAMKRRYNG
jgi:hypothetical protein